MNRFLKFISRSIGETQIDEVWFFHFIMTKYDERWVENI
jgi:hypothetical protein